MIIEKRKRIVSQKEYDTIKSLLRKDCLAVVVKNVVKMYNLN